MADNNTNPWLLGNATPQPTVEVHEPGGHGYVPRATRPQHGVPSPDKADQLPRRQVPSVSGIWFLSAHGGAGESTLAKLLPGGGAAGHAWPVAVDGRPSDVVLVCRSNAAGLRAAQLAIQDWASGSLPNVRLLGLVIVADAKGSLPRPLQNQVRVLSGAVPRTWSMPWLDTLRLNQSLDLSSAPRGIRSLVASIAAASGSN